jgi:hypothetical protein
LLLVGALLAAVLLVGIAAGWLLIPRDQRSTTGIDAVRGTPASTTLDVTYVAGAEGCADPGGVRADETSDEIRLTASTLNRRVRPFSTTACPAIAISARTDVRLSAPLGTRRVIDTSRDGDGIIVVQAP